MGDAPASGRRAGTWFVRVLAPCLVLAASGLLVTSCQLTQYGVPDSIADDCSVNVSSQLNAWMASVPDASELLFRGGCYRVDQTLVLTDRNFLVLRGQGATFRTNDPTGDGSPVSDPSDAARTRAMWRFVGGSNIELRTMTIKGPHPNAPLYVQALEAQHGVDIQGTVNMAVADVSIFDVYGDFVYFGRRGAQMSSGRVFDSELRRNGRHGFAVTGGQDISFDHNIVSDTARATLDLEPNAVTTVVSNITFSDNTVGEGRLLFVAGVTAATLEDITVSDNVLQGRSMNMVIANNGTGLHRRITVTGNRSDDSFGTTGPAGVLEFSSVDDLTVKSNLQPAQPGRNVSGVELGDDVTGAVIRGNSFVDAVSAVYLVTGTAGYTACGNQLVAGGPYDQPDPC